MFSHACKCSGRHLVVHEEDHALFVATLSPLCDPTPTSSVGESMAHNTFDDSNKDHVKKVAKENLLNK